MNETIVSSQAYFLIKLHDFINLRHRADVIYKDPFTSRSINNVEKLCIFVECSNDNVRLVTIDPVTLEKWFYQVYDEEVDKLDNIKLSKVFMKVQKLINVVNPKQPYQIKSTAE